MKYEIDDFNFNNLNSKLAHLNTEEVVTLINRYYAEEKINNLIKEYSIKVQPSKLISLFPYLKIERFLCHTDV